MFKDATSGNRRNRSYLWNVWNGSAFIIPLATLSHCAGAGWSKVGPCENIAPDLCGANGLSCLIALTRGRIGERAGSTWGMRSGGIWVSTSGTLHMKVAHKLYRMQLAKKPATGSVNKITQRKPFSCQSESNFPVTLSSVTRKRIRSALENVIYAMYMYMYVYCIVYVHVYALCYLLHNL